MFGVTDLASYIIGAIIIVLIPGPNSIYIMTVASRYGIKAGYRGALGIVTGDFILILCTILGAASLLKAFQWLFTLLKIIGALYLSYLGIQLLIQAYRLIVNKKLNEVETASNGLDMVHPYRTALSISLLNPKAILFFLSFFVQFVDPQYPYPILTFACLAIILQIISLSYLSTLIFSGVRFAEFFQRSQKISSAGLCLVALLFLGFGFKLANATIS